MALAYSKELLVNAFMHKFEVAGIFPQKVLTELRELADTHYDKVGKDKFRIHASVTPEVVKNYKEWMTNQN